MSPQQVVELAISLVEPEPSIAGGREAIADKALGRAYQLALIEKLRKAVVRTQTGGKGA